MFKSWTLPLPMTGCIGALLFAGVLSGCSLAPRYERPPAPVAADFNAVTAGDARLEASALGWRQFFPDPRLQELITEALANNRDLRTAALNIEAAKATYRIAETAIFPTLDAGFTASRARTPPSQTSNARAIIGNSYTSGLSSAFELDFFGRIASLRDAALASYLGTQASRRSAQISLVAEVAQAYLAEVALGEQEALAKQTLDSRVEDLRLTKMRFDVGASSALDYQLSNTLVESARVDWSALKRQRAQATNALTLLVGKPLAELPDGFRLENQQIVTDIPAGLPSSLLERRPDIAAAEQALLAANANIGVARAAFFPSVSLTGQYGGASTALGSLFSPVNRAWSFAPTVNLPIFEGGLNVANLKLSEVRKNLAIVDYEKSIQAAFREVSDALVARGTLDDQLQSQLAYLNAQQERAKLTDLLFTNGVASSTDRLNAQRDLFSAQQTLIQTRQLRLNNAIDLYRYLGGGLNEETVVAAQNDVKPAAPALAE